MKILIAADAAFAGKDRVRAFYDADAEAVFKPIRAFFRIHDAAVTFIHRIGLPGPSIAKFAERNRFDLIVFGTHGHGTVAGLVMGSVATKVLSLCTIQPSASESGTVVDLDALAIGRDELYVLVNWTGHWVDPSCGDSVR